MKEEINSFYLRIEAANLWHFINDTNDLSTIRGGSLLLLEATQKAEDIINSKLPSYISPAQQEINELQIELEKLKNQANKTKSEKNKADKLREKLKKRKDNLKKLDPSDSGPAITKGASWGLFKFDSTQSQVNDIKDAVVNYFKTDIKYKYATFVIDILPSNDENAYQKDRNILQTLNHWQQMQAPSLAISKEGLATCAINKVSVATDKKTLKSKEIYVSESVFQRREYGKKQKHAFYKKITEIDAKFTNDLTTLSKVTLQNILDGKIAYIYIDGNDFGKTQRSSKTPSVQKAFDQNTRNGREKVLKAILSQIKEDPNWLTKNNKIRLETLLWGGDEIIWVVPAWKGWWMINEFYEQAKQHIKHENIPMCHASGLVFCHHNAPIHRIDTLARNLADIAKTNRDKNLIAYQILESFDHAGSQLSNFRESRLLKLGEPQDMLVNADYIHQIECCIYTLKDDENFAKRKIYQIIHAYRSDNTEKADEYANQLTSNLSLKSQKAIEKLKDFFGNNNTHWLHLMDLWDYFDRGNM